MRIGDITIKIDDGRENKLCDVIHVLDLGNTFLSIKMMDKLGYSTTFGYNHGNITKETLVVGKGESYWTLYRVWLCSENHATLTKSWNVLDPLMLWHQ